MKTFRSTAVFFLFTVSMVAAVYFLVYKKDKEDQEKKEAGAVILKLNQEKVSHFEMHTHSGDSVFDRKNGTWMLQKPVEDEGDGAIIANYLSNIIAEKSEETVEEGSAIQWDRYGLDKPVSSMELQTEDGQKASIKIGSKSFDTSLYARINDEQKVVLVGGSWDGHISKPARDLRNKKLYRKGSGEEIEQLELQHGRAAAISFKKEKDNWKLAAGGSSEIPLGKDAVKNYVEQIRNLRVQDFVAEDKTDLTVVKTLHLDHPFFVVRVKRINLPELKLEFSEPLTSTKHDGKKATANEPSPDPFALSSDLKGIVRVSHAGYETLNKSVEDFYDKRLPFIFNLAEVTHVSIHTPQASVDAAKKGADWILDVTDPHKVLDGAKLSEMLSKVKDLEVARYLGKVSGKGFKPGEREIIFKNAKGEAILNFSWGEKIDGSTVPAYFAKSNLFAQVFSVSTGVLDGLPLKDLLKDKIEAGKAGKAANPAELPSSPPITSAGTK